MHTVHLVTLNTTPFADVAELLLSGDLDHSATEQLDAVCGSVMASGCRLLVLDFAGVHFVDGTALRALERIYVAARAQGAELMLVGANRTIRKVFEICRSPLYVLIDDG